MIINYHYHIRAVTKTLYQGGQAVAKGGQAYFKNISMYSINGKYFKNLIKNQ